MNECYAHLAVRKAATTTVSCMKRIADYMHRVFESDVGMRMSLATHDFILLELLSFGCQ